MSIVYNGTTVEKVIYGGTELDELYYNGTKVYSAGPKIVTWADGTDAEIAAMIAAADAGQIDLTDYWDIGDTRTVHLNYAGSSAINAQDVELVLVAKDTGISTSENPCYNYQYVTATSGRTYPSFIVQQKNGLNMNSDYKYMNSTNSNAGSWDGSKARTRINSLYKSMFGTFGNIFKQVKVKTAETYNGSTIKESNDYFFFATEKEIQGSISYSNNVETILSRWPYYISADKKKKNPANDTFESWWMRSPCKNNTTCFCCVYENGGAYYGSAYSNRLLMVPAGCI